VQSKKKTKVCTFIGLFLVRCRCPERSNHRWVPRPTVPPLARGAPRQLCCILTKPVIMPPPPVLTFSLTLPYLNAPRSQYICILYESAATRRRTLRGNGMKTQPHIMIAGPREMRIICTRVSYSVCVFLDVRLVAQFARAECVLIITYVMSARAFHARFNFGIWLWCERCCVYAWGLN